MSNLFQCWVYTTTVYKVNRSCLELWTRSYQAPSLVPSPYGDEATRHRAQDMQLENNRAIYLRMRHTPYMEDLPPLNFP